VSCIGSEIEILTARYCPGDDIAALDGCNRCSCTDGQVTCTNAECPCDPAREHWREYVDTNTDRCKVSIPSCANGLTWFSNACGCQRSPECPAVTQCVTGELLAPGPLAEP